jgi:hypothetical protein
MYRRMRIWFGFMVAGPWNSYSNGCERCGGITKPYFIATNKFAFQLSPLIYVWFLHLLNKKNWVVLIFFIVYSFRTVYNGGQVL